MEQTVQSTQETSPNNNLGNLINLGKDLNKIALIDDRGKVTYKQLHDMSNHAANILKTEKNIKPGDRVGIKGFNSIGFVAAYLGILKTGGVAVLINPVVPESQIDYIAKNDKLKFLWIDPVFPKDKIIDFETYPVKNNDPAVILYTSGSTSNYKGVIRSHRHKMFLRKKVETITGDKEKMLISQSLTWAAGLIQLEMSLIKHNTSVFLGKFDSKKFLKKIFLHKINSASVVPSMLSLILNEKELLSKLDLSSLQFITTSSATISNYLWTETKKIFPQVRLRNVYGSTESGPNIFGEHPTLPTPDLSVGYPLSQIDYRIVDGILQLRSPSTMLGYTNATSHSLTDDGYFITNDLFRIDENGFYFYLGRADDMFTSGGHNIFPKQIEDVLKQHPGVKDAAVIAIEDDIKGHKPYSFVISQCEEYVLRSHILNFFPQSHCPRRIWNLEQMPLNINYKIDKKALILKAKTLLEKDNDKSAHGRN